MPKVDFRSVGKAIRGAQQRIKAARKQVSPADQAQLDELMSKLDGVYAQVEECCPKAMTGLPLAVVRKASKAAKPRKAAKPKRRTR